jgi:AraC family transcriptional regulator
MSNWSLSTTISGPFFAALHSSNVLLAARARKHTARAFAGPLSIKGVVGGEATWVVEGVRYEVDSTSCVVVNQNVPYDMQVDSHTDVETFVVFFSDHLTSDAANASSRSLQDLLDEPRADLPCSPQILHRLWTNETPVHKALHALRECTHGELEQGEVDRHLRGALDGLMQAADEVSAERNRIAADRESTRRELHRRVLRGKAFLDQTLCSPFDLGSAAREAWLAPHHFHRTFRAVTGRTPFGYVSARRIERAKRLLIEKDWDVAEIVAALGYTSTPSFTRLFRKCVGQTPAQYRSMGRIRKPE